MEFHFTDEQIETGRVNKVTGLVSVGLCPSRPTPSSSPSSKRAPTSVVNRLPCPPGGWESPEWGYHHVTVYRIHPPYMPHEVNGTYHIFHKWKLHVKKER